MRMKALVVAASLVLGCATAAQAATVLAPGATWEYTFADPTGDPVWNTTLGGWDMGAAPFGNTVGGDFGFNTFWPASGAGGDDLWVRTALDLTGYDLTSVLWDLGVDNGFKLFVNGNLVAADNAEGFTWRWEYAGAIPAAFLVPGVNIVAVALEDHGGLTAFDMQVRAEAVPEPASLILLGIAVAAAARRRLS